MARKVTIKHSSRKPLILNTEPEPPPPQKRLVIKSAKDKQKSKASGQLEPGTFVVDGYVLKIEKRNALDATVNQAVELNSSSLDESVAQIPLDPDQVAPSPQVPEPSQKSFKFHCYRCGQRLKVPVSWANMSIPCGKCGHDLVIPPPLITPES